MAENTQRDFITRLGNWHDVVDDDGNGSLIAIFKDMNSIDGGGPEGEYFNNYMRSLENRIGNFEDLADVDGNGSLIAQWKRFSALFQLYTRRIGQDGIIKDFAGNHTVTNLEAKATFRVNASGSGGDGYTITLNRSFGAPGLVMNTRASFTITVERHPDDATAYPIIIVDEDGNEYGRIISPCAVIVPYLIAYADGVRIVCKGVP